MPAAQTPALSGLLVKCWSELKSLRVIVQVFLPEQDDITSWIKKKKKKETQLLQRPEILVFAFSLEKLRTDIDFLESVVRRVASFTVQRHAGTTGLQSSTEYSRWPQGCWATGAACLSLGPLHPACPGVAWWAGRGELAQARCAPRLGLPAA